MGPHCNLPAWEHQRRATALAKLRALNGVSDGAHPDRRPDRYRDLPLHSERAASWWADPEGLAARFDREDEPLGLSPEEIKHAEAEQPAIRERRYREKLAALENRTPLPRRGQLLVQALDFVRAILGLDRGEPWARPYSERRLPPVPDEKNAPRDPRTFGDAGLRQEAVYAITGSDGRFDPSRDPAPVWSRREAEEKRERRARHDLLVPLSRFPPWSKVP